MDVGLDVYGDGHTAELVNRGHRVCSFFSIVLYILYMMGSVDELSTDSVKDIIDHVRKIKRKRPDKDSICHEAELRHGLDKDTVAHMLDKLTLENKLYIKESYFVNENHVNENDQLWDIVLLEEPKLTEVDDKQRFLLKSFNS